MVGPLGVIGTVVAVGKALINGAKAVGVIERKFIDLRGTIQTLTGARGSVLDELTVGADAPGNYL